MGGAVSAGENNDHLIDNLKEANYIKTVEVEWAFRSIDRAHYYLPDFKDLAYKDLAWKHENIHLSAPCIYSEVVEALEIQPGLSFLNIGSGTGYLNTLVGLLIGRSGVNHGVELYADNVAYANEKYFEFTEGSQSFDKYEVCEPCFIQGNALEILSNSRLYDRIYCGAGCPQALAPNFKNLLSIGGILVIPIDDQLQKLHRQLDGSWEITSVLPVSFAQLIIPNDMSYAVCLPSPSVISLKNTARLVIRHVIREVLRQNESTKKIGLSWFQVRQNKRKKNQKRKSKQRHDKRFLIRRSSDARHAVEQLRAFVFSRNNDINDEIMAMQYARDGSDESGSDPLSSSSDEAQASDSVIIQRDPVLHELASSTTVEVNGKTACSSLDKGQAMSTVVDESAVRSPPVDVPAGDGQIKPMDYECTAGTSRDRPGSVNEVLLPDPASGSPDKLAERNPKAESVNAVRYRVCDVFEPSSEPVSSLDGRDGNQGSANDHPEDPFPAENIADEEDTHGSADSANSSYGDESTGEESSCVDDMSEGDCTVNPMRERILGLPLPLTLVAFLLFYRRK